VLHGRKPPFFESHIKGPGRCGVLSDKADIMGCGAAAISHLITRDDWTVKEAAEAIAPYCSCQPDQLIQWRKDVLSRGKKQESNTWFMYELHEHGLRSPLYNFEGLSREAHLLMTISVLFPNEEMNPAPADTLRRV
jgi:hypothetical protein